MGFWQGLNEGLGVIREEKARKRELEARQQEIETERGIRKQEREQDWQRQIEMFKMQQTQGFQEALYSQYAKRQEALREVENLKGKANTFLSRIGDIDDPRVAQLASNPVVAAQLEDTYQKIQSDLSGKGIDPVPLEGQTLLDALTVQGSQGQVLPVDISPEDIAAVTSQEDFFKTLFELSQPVVPTVSASFKPEVYFVPDPKNLQEGRNLFDQLVLEQANAYLEQNAGDANVDAEIRPLIEDYAKEGSAAKTKLRSMFGVTAAATLLETSGNPYLSGIQKDPQLAPFLAQAYTVSEQQNLKAIVDNPGTPPDQRQDAIDLLKTRHNIDYGKVNLNGR
jgi:hypothetical protein